ncbi:MAG: DUF1501 domain-containing protein [Planctomycetales bacterium]
MTNNFLTRRQMLSHCGMGFAALGLGAMAAADVERLLSPMAPRVPHFAPRAKHVIHLFLNGGLSQVDTFDYKPAIARHEGKKLPGIGADRLGTHGAGMPSPYKFRQYGSNGLYVSELFERLGKVIDQVCVVNSMHTDSPEHGDARLLINCGSVGQNSPSAGAWLTYGLGTENQNLPGFVAMCPGNGQLPEDGATGWRAGFMPPVYQGTLVDTWEPHDVSKLINNINNPFIGKRQHRRQIELLHRLNRRHVDDRGGDPALEARIQSYEMAYRMQAAATDAFDLSREPQHIRELYGDS